MVPLLTISVSLPEQTMHNKWAGCVHTCAYECVSKNERDRGECLPIFVQLCVCVLQTATKTQMDLADRTVWLYHRLLMCAGH